MEDYECCKCGEDEDLIYDEEGNLLCTDCFFEETVYSYEFPYLDEKEW